MSKCGMDWVHVRLTGTWQTWVIVFSYSSVFPLTTGIQCILSVVDIIYSVFCLIKHYILLLNLCFFVIRLYFV